MPDLISLPIAAWFLYRFDEYADNYWTGSSIFGFIRQFLFSAHFLHLFAFLALLGLLIFLSSEAKIALALSGLLFGLYFGLVLYSTAFKGHVKSIFASFLFTLACLIGTPIFVLIYSENVLWACLAGCVWLIILYNMWLCKTYQIRLQMPTTSKWFLITIYVGCFLILFVLKWLYLSIYEVVFAQLALLFPAQWASACFFELNTRIMVDLTLLVGLCFTIVLAI